MTAQAAANSAPTPMREGIADRRSRLCMRIAGKEAERAGHDRHGDDDGAAEQDAAPPCSLGGRSCIGGHWFSLAGTRFAMRAAAIWHGNLAIVFAARRRTAAARRMW